MQVAQEKLLKSWRAALGNVVRKHKAEVDQWDSFVDRDMLGILEEERPRMERVAAELGAVSAAVRDELSLFVRSEDLAEAEGSFLSEALHLLNAAVLFENESIVLIDPEESFEKMADGIRNIRRGWDKIAVAVNLPDASYGRKKQRDIAEVEARFEANPRDWPRCASDTKPNAKRNGGSDPTKKRYRNVTHWQESVGGRRREDGAHVSPWFHSIREANDWVMDHPGFHGGHKVRLEEGSAIRASR